MTTHADLVSRAEKWLSKTKRCSFVLSEQNCFWGEIPDAIGWSGSTASYLVECKVSETDFVRDLDKSFRKDPANGMGSYRYLMCPPGLIKPEWLTQLPARFFSARIQQYSHAGWGLLYVDRRQVRQIIEPTRFDQKNTQAETAFLITALRRCQVRAGQPLTSWLKYANRLQEMNGGVPLNSEVNA